VTTALATTAPLVTTAGAGSRDLCRLTVVGRTRQADLGVPLSLPIGDLLPVLLRQLTDEPVPDSGWALHRLGGAPLDLDATVEMLGLPDGEKLYLTPAAAVLPDLRFDDLAVGVAGAVAARGDQWRPEFTPRLLLGLAAVILLAVPLGVLGSGGGPVAGLSLGLGAALLTIGAGVFSRLVERPAAGILAGLGACGYAALAGLVVRHGSTGRLAPDRQDVFWSAIYLTLAAVAVLIAGRVPTAPFGTLLGVGAGAGTAALLSLTLGLTAAQAAAVLAVTVFVATSLALRLALRVAKLRVPALPHTAAELARDAEPEPEAVIGRRAATATALLAGLIGTLAIVSTVAFALLTRTSGWAGWVLTAVFGLALLLRARSLTSAWQRIPLVLAGVVGLLLVINAWAAGMPASVRIAVVVALIAAAAGLLAATRRGAGGRPLPVWGHLADLSETWTAIALIPLLLQVIGLYAFFRSLIG
jgi:type VII secretion integral membrane protein EccD